jgi:hypothetical protein
MDDASGVGLSAQIARFRCDFADFAIAPTGANADGLRESARI